mgnify:CR=1 FL=1
MRSRRMSIRLYCRSKANRRAAQAGQALVMALIIMLVALPVGITFYRYVGVTLRTAMAERQQKTASQFANAAVTD